MVDKWMRMCYCCAVPEMRRESEVKEMVNTLQLKARIMSEGYTQRSLAKEIGINKNTLNSKVNGNVQFNIDEVEKICKVLHINTSEDKCAIFLQGTS